MDAPLIHPNIEALKLKLFQRTSFTFPLSKSNAFHQNLSRIEAIKAELQEMVENQEADAPEELFLKHWIKDLEKSYIGEFYCG